MENIAEVGGVVQSSKKVCKQDVARNFYWDQIHSHQGMID